MLAVTNMKKENATRTHPLLVGHGTSTDNAAPDVLDSVHQHHDNAVALSGVLSDRTGGTRGGETKLTRHLPRPRT